MTEREGGCRQRRCRGGGCIPIDPLRAANLALQGRVEARLWFSTYCLTTAIGAPPQDAKQLGLQRWSPTVGRDFRNVFPATFPD